MTAPESRPDIESALTDAFQRRHARQGPSRPSLVDVRRRAHRQSSRRAAVRAGAVVGAGAAVVAGGWAVTRETSPPTAVPAGPVTATSVPPGTPIGVAITTLSVDDLWAAVAARLGTTVDELRLLNPTVDFGAAPVPNTPIVIRSDDEAAPNITAPWPTVVTTSAPLADPTAPPTTVWIDTTVTIVGGVAVSQDPLGCVLTDEQIQALTEYARSLPAPGEDAPMPSLPAFAACPSVSSLPEGWTFYRIMTGDYLYGIAMDFCTTAEEIAAANGWTAGVSTPLSPGDLIAVPADAC